jgi:hypothetical protein
MLSIECTHDWFADSGTTGNMTDKRPFFTPMLNDPIRKVLGYLVYMYATAEQLIS